MYRAFFNKVSTLDVLMLSTRGFTMQLRIYMSCSIYGYNNDTLDHLLVCSPVAKLLLGSTNYIYGLRFNTAHYKYFGIAKICLIESYTKANKWIFLVIFLATLWNFWRSTNVIRIKVMCTRMILDETKVLELLMNSQHDKERLVNGNGLSSTTL